MISYILILSLMFSYCRSEQAQSEDHHKIEPLLSTDSSYINSDDTLILSQDEEDPLIKEEAELDIKQSEQSEQRDELQRKIPLDEEIFYEEQLEQEGEPKISTGVHDGFDKFLKRYVSVDGRVNYKGMKNELDLLNSYLNELSSLDALTMTRDEELAFWINVYNAYTIKLILDNYPLKSITELDGGKVWDREWIEIKGLKYSLNQIENEIIRPKFNEPRIHFAVNCAAKSCPPLLNAAWTASNLESNLERQAFDFVNNIKYNTISEDHVQVSKIFEWYAGDFGNLIEYLNRYSTTKIKSTAVVKYLEYDWNLNE